MLLNLVQAYAMLGNIRARWEQTPTPLAPKSMRAAALALLFVCVAAISFNSIVVQCYGSLSVRMWPFYSCVVHACFALPCWFRLIYPFGVEWFFSLPLSKFVRSHFLSLFRCNRRPWGAHARRHARCQFVVGQDCTLCHSHVTCVGVGA